MCLVHGDRQKASAVSVARVRSRKCVCVCVYAQALCVRRLFIRSSGPGDPSHPQQIAYLNVVPACVDPGGLLSMPKFADFAITIAELNNMFRQNPIQGERLAGRREL